MHEKMKNLKLQFWWKIYISNVRRYLTHYYFDSSKIRCVFRWRQHKMKKKNQILFEIDENHKHVIAIDRLKSKYCKKILRMSIRVSNFFMTTFFKFQFRKIFVKNYNMTNVVIFEMQSFQWYKKIIFIFKCVRLR